MTERPGLTGRRVGITADRRWRAQADLLENLGAEVIHGPTLRTPPAEGTSASSSSIPSSPLSSVGMSRLCIPRRLSARRSGARVSPGFRPRVPRCRGALVGSADIADSAHRTDRTGTLADGTPVERYVLSSPGVGRGVAGITGVPMPEAGLRMS